MKDQLLFLYACIKFQFYQLLTFLNPTKVIVQPSSCPHLSSLIDLLHHHGYTPRYPKDLLLVELLNLDDQMGGVDGCGAPEVPGASLAGPGLGSQVLLVVVVLLLLMVLCCRCSFLCC